MLPAAAANHAIPKLKFQKTKMSNIQKPKKTKIRMSDLMTPDPVLPPSLVRDTVMVVNPDVAAVNTSQPKSVSTASLKHKIQSRSANDIYAAAEARRTKFTRKYRSHCKKFKIPYPEVGIRESEHLNECHMCQQTWPLFLFEQHHVCKHSMADVSKAWANLPEYERTRLHQILSQADRAWMKSMIKSKTASAYQIFNKDIAQRQEIKDMPTLKAKQQHIAALWKSQPPEIRQRYEEHAKKTQAERLNTLNNLPEFKRRQVDRARREYRRVCRECHPPKPASAYMMYLKDAWKEESKKPEHVPYLEFVTMTAKRWKTEVPEEVKKPYEDDYKQRRINYFIARDAAITRVKQLKQEQIQARQLIKEARKKRKIEAPPAASDCEGDEKVQPPPPIGRIPNVSPTSEEDEDDEKEEEHNSEEDDEEEDDDEERESDTDNN